MKTQTSNRGFIALASCAAAALACMQLQRPAPTPAAVPAMPITTEAPAAAPTAGAAPSAASTETPGAAATSEVTATAVSSLKGSVLVRSNCRYGPGAYYLYKIGMLAGAPIEALGRDVDGGWAYIQFAGTHNLCWINSKQIQLEGDIMSLQDYYPERAPLPMATKYGPVSIMSVSSDGASVTVEWSPIVLPEVALPGEGEMQYVIEVWTCVSGSPGFYTLGTNETNMTFQVDDSCGQRSHADIVAQNKLGVSGITQISLP